MKKLKQTIKKILAYRDLVVEIIMLLLFVYILEQYGWKGAGYWLLAMILYTCYVIWKMYPYIKAQRQMIEIILFGKTLEKENWQPGENPLARFKKKKVE